MHAATQAPPAQSSPDPQAVPSGFGVVGLQVPGVPGPAHAIAPLLQGLAGSQDAPGTQLAATHDPPLQTVPVPQEVPSGLLPVTMQPGSDVGVAHDVVPSVQGFGGWQTWFGEHVPGTHEPSLQKSPPPHALPFGRLPESAQVAVAYELLQVVTPALHGLDD